MKQSDRFFWRIATLLFTYSSLLYLSLYLKEGFISISGDDRTTMESKFPLNPNIPTRVVTTPSMKNVIILPAPMTVKEEKRVDKKSE